MTTQTHTKADECIYSLNRFVFVSLASLTRYTLLQVRTIHRGNSNSNRPAVSSNTVLAKPYTCRDAMQDSSASLSFCDFNDSTTEGSIIVSKRDTCPAAPSDCLPVSTIRSPLLQGNAPRLDVDWSDSPPLSVCSLSFPDVHAALT
jgi:hypothetical protein